jgi:uncharacterized phage protein (TIGR02218 family)
MRTASAALKRILHRTRFGRHFTDGPAQSFNLAPAAMPVNQFTFEAQIAAISLPGSAAQLLRCNPTANGAYRLNLNAAGTLGFILRDNGAVDRTITSSSVMDKNARHVVCRFDGTTHSILVGAVAEASSAAAAGTNLSGTGFTYFGNALAGFDVLMDDVRWYNRALSDKEVRARLAGQHIQQGLIQWIGFDEGSGATAFEYSGTGTSVAMPGAFAYEAFDAHPELLNQLVKADLYTFLDAGGAVLGRFTNADKDLKIGANTFIAAGPEFSRGNVKTVVGVQADSLELTLATDGSHLLAGSPWLSAIRNGALTGGRVKLERFLSDDWENTGVGSLIWFSGRIAPKDVGRFEATLRVKSDLSLLNVSMPRDPFQPGCKNTLYDARCQVNRATFTKSGSVAAAGSTLISVRCPTIAGVPTDDWCARGVLTFTSGALNGITRGVRSNKKGAPNDDIFLTQPLPSIPVTGVTFTVTAGCNKDRDDDCAAKFANTANYRGERFIPKPETLL